MTRNLGLPASVVWVAFLSSCALPLGLPPASNVSRFARTSWDEEGRARKGKVAATAAGQYLTSVGGSSSGSVGQVITAEAAARLDLHKHYQLAPSVSTSMLGLDGQVVLLAAAAGSVGLLHGVGFGLGFQAQSSGSTTNRSGVFYFNFNGGLMGQLRAGPGTFFGAVRYAYGTGASFGMQAGGAQFAPSHYVLGNVGYVLKVGSVVGVSPEFGMGWMKPVSSGAGGASDMMVFAPSVTVSADF
ncbi:MAG: hypothetical protein IT380_20405 [Myxococcales bacterium]|nr:hypothetical protein [Myxococcales bacterium]